MNFYDMYLKTNGTGLFYGAYSSVDTGIELLKSALSMENSRFSLESVEADWFIYQIDQRQDIRICFQAWIASEYLPWYAIRGVEDHSVVGRFETFEEARIYYDVPLEKSTDSPFKHPYVGKWNGGDLTVAPVELDDLYGASSLPGEYFRGIAMIDRVVNVLQARPDMIGQIIAAQGLTFLPLLASTLLDTPIRYVAYALNTDDLEAITAALLIIGSTLRDE